MTRGPPLPLVLLLAGAATLLLAAGLARPAGTEGVGAAGEVRKGGTLRLSRHVDVDHVDPALAYYADSGQLEYATCAKLFNYPDKAGEAGTRLIPEVVKAFTVSKDRRTYTFELQRTFRFHTGAPVTARSFVDAFNRDANPRMRSPAASFMHEIVGADAVIDGTATSISGVRALDRYRLQIRLTKPTGFTARLTMPFFCPIPPNTPVDPAGTDTPAGSGPYYVAERIVNQRIVLERNPYYHGGRPANVDRVVWTIGTSREDCLLATEQNRIDLCVLFGIPETAYRRLAETYGVNRAGGQFFVSGRLDTWYFAFDHDRLAFKGLGQIPLMKAINFALDRRALARTFGYLGGKSDDQMLPPTLGRDESIYALGSGDTATDESGSPGKAPAGQARALRVHRPLPKRRRRADVRLQPEADRRRRRGEVLRSTDDFPQDGHAREPFDVAMVAWSMDYADRRRTSGRSSTARTSGRRQPERLLLRRPAVNARIVRQTACPAQPAQGFGRPRRRPDAEQPAMGAVISTPLAPTSSRAATAASSSTPSMASTSPPPARSRWPAGSHSRSRCSPWDSACSSRPLSRARSGSARAGEAPKGGTLRLRRPRTSTSSTRRSPTGRWSSPIGTRRARSCSTIRTRRVRPGRGSCRRSSTGSRSRRTGGRTPSTLKKTFRFHTGATVTAQSFADAINRVAQPRLESPATAYMREIVGATSVIDGKAAIDLRRPRARPLPAADPADQAARGLHRPTDAAVLLPDPAEHADRGDRTPRPGSGPYYVAERIVNQRIVLKRNPFYRGDRPATSTRSSRRSARARRPAYSPSSRTGSTTADSASPETDVPDPGREVRHQPTRRAVLRQSHALYVVPSRSTTTGPRSKAPARSRSRRRSTTRSTGPSWPARLGYLAGKRTDQMLPPELARPASIYPLGGANPATARNWLARARLRPDRLVLYAPTSVQCRTGPGARLRPQADRHRPRGEVLRHTRLAAKAATRGEPFDLALVGWVADYADAAAFFVPLLDRGAACGVNLDDPACNARIEAANRLTGSRRDARPGPTSTST